MPRTAFQAPPGHKRCSSCHRVLPLDVFSRDASKRDGLDIRCRDCRRERNQASYLARRDISLEQRVDNKEATEARRAEGRLLLGRLMTKIRKTGEEPRFTLDEAAAWYTGTNHVCPDCQKPVDVTKDRTGSNGAVVEVHGGTLRVCHRGCKAGRRRLPGTGNIVSMEGNTARREPWGERRVAASPLRTDSDVRHPDGRTTDDRPDPAR